MADHIGQYPVVFISPYDGDLIAEGSELRRRWMDGILVQIDREYLEQLQFKKQAKKPPVINLDFGNKLQAKKAVPKPKTIIETRMS